mgnify:CR=1 FL=1
MTRNTRHPFKWIGLLTPLSVCVALAVGSFELQASPIDDENQPEASDPSAYQDEPSDEPAALSSILTMPEANEDSFDLPNYVKGTKTDLRVENVLPPAAQTSFNYPTNGKPSPLFGALPFTQQLLLFEEFGPTRLDPTTPAGPLGFPPPALGPAPQQDPDNMARSGPSKTALEKFLHHQVQVVIVGSGDPALAAWPCRNPCD